MRKSKRFFFPCLLVSLVAFSQTENTDFKHCVSEVRVLDFEDEDFSDLEVIGEKMADARIVMLGEHRHGDGTTLKAKNRLIKYLHEKKGFNIILMEYDMYAMVKTNELLNKSVDPFVAFRKPYNTNSGSKTSVVLYNYIGATKASKTSLKAHGLDIGTNPYTIITNFLPDLSKVIKETDSIFLESKEWKNYTNLIYRIVYNKQDTLQKLFPELEVNANHVLAFIRNQQSFFPEKAEKLDLWEQLVKSNLGYARWYALKPIKKPTKKNSYLNYNLRDKQMADNASWYIEMYRNEKIIITTSTFHTSRNLTTLKPKNNYYYNELKPMGQYLWEKYSGEIYSIAFIEHSGETGRFLAVSKKVQKKSKGSVEDELNKLGTEYLFMDLKNIDESCKGLVEERYMTPTLVESKGNWNKIYDALFFIRTMNYDDWLLNPIGDEPME